MKTLEERAHEYAEAQGYTKGTIRAAARKAFIDAFTIGAREGWMRCGVFNVDIDFEHSAEQSPTEKKAEWLALAHDVESAAAIEFYSGDREPGTSLSKSGRKLLAEALRIAAAQQK
jgi:hypothetical protein